MSENSKAVRSVMFRTNGVIKKVMRKLGFEFYLVPIPKRTGVDSGSSSSLIYTDVNWLRLPMYTAIGETIGRLETASLSGKDAVELGGSEGTILGMLRARGVKTEVAPDYPVVDIENVPFSGERYDFVVLDQVLEHVVHPWKAVAEVKRILKRGGICICTSVFVYPIHKGFVGSFGDYFRFSPEGLRSLFDGFEIISAEGWGNSDVMKLVYQHSERGPEGSAPMSKEEAKRAGLYDHTDGMNYLMTWCIAKKTGPP